MRMLPIFMHAFFPIILLSRRRTSNLPTNPKKQGLYVWKNGRAVTKDCDVEKNRNVCMLKSHGPATEYNNAHKWARVQERRRLLLLLLRIIFLQPCQRFQPRLRNKYATETLYAKRTSGRLQASKLQIANGFRWCLSVISSKLKIC